MQNILITGATGHLGHAITTQLLDRVPAAHIHVLVRDAAKASDLADRGIQVRVGDYHDRASLDAALQGIDKVLLISSSDFNDRLGQHKNVVDAAKAAGVQHILYTGVTMTDINASPLKPLLASHFETEDYILASGLTYTFLRNSLYMDVLPMFLGAGVLETGVFFPASEGKVAFAARQDLAEATANVLSSTGHENQTYALSNTQAYNFADVAAALSDIAGKPVPYISPDPATFEATLRQFGLPEPIVQMSAMFAAAMASNEFNILDGTLARLLGRPQTDLRTYLAATFTK